MFYLITLFQDLSEALSIFYDSMPKAEVKKLLI